MDKSALLKAKQDHALHVALLVRSGVSKSVALVTAYAEGSAGLDRRLGQGVLPLASFSPPAKAT